MCGSTNEKLSKSPAEICANGCMYIMTTNHRVFPSWHVFSFGGIDRRKKQLDVSKLTKVCWTSRKRCSTSGLKNIWPKSANIGCIVKLGLEALTDYLSNIF